jgi:molybdate transport system substrate-binding protein
MIESLSRVALFLAAAATCGCTAEPPAQGTADAPTSRPAEASPEILVFAAASTTDAVDEIARRFHEARGIRVNANYAATSTLAQQVVHGGGADVFLSANEKWADFLEEKGLVAKRSDLLGNRIVVVVPSDSKLRIETPEDLLDPGVQHLALAEPSAAPAGIYAKEALTKLGLWDRLESKVAAGADVRQALAYVETGAAEAGIVYATDAAASSSVKVACRIDPGLTRPIVYPLVLLEGGENEQAAQAFYEYLQGPEAAEVFRSHGFEVLAAQPPPAGRITPKGQP